jgi:hypothetical protein
MASSRASAGQLGAQPRLNPYPSMPSGFYLQMPKTRFGPQTLARIKEVFFALTPSYTQDENAGGEPRWVLV